MWDPRLDPGREKEPWDHYLEFCIYHFLDYFHNFANHVCEANYITVPSPLDTL